MRKGSAARRHLASVAVALGCLSAAGPAAAEAVSELLARVGPKAPASAAGDVDVLAWVESERGYDRTLVITFATRGDAKLVADPGVSATPGAGSGITWAADTPTTLTIAGQGYFGAPPVLRLPFRSAAGDAVEAQVDYAYCLIERQCLFGAETVRVELGTAPSGS